MGNASGPSQNPIALLVSGRAHQVRILRTGFRPRQMWSLQMNWQQAGSGILLGNLPGAKKRIEMIISRCGCRRTNRRCSAEEMKVSRRKKRIDGGIEKIRTRTSVNVEVDETGSKITTIRIDSINHIWGYALADDLYQFVGDL